MIEEDKAVFFRCHFDFVELLVHYGLDEGVIMDNMPKMGYYVEKGTITASHRDNIIDLTWVTECSFLPREGDLLECSEMGEILMEFLRSKGQWITDLDGGDDVIDLICDDIFCGGFVVNETQFWELYFDDSRDRLFPYVQCQARKTRYIKESQESDDGGSELERFLQSSVYDFIVSSNNVPTRMSNAVIGRSSNKEYMEGITIQEFLNADKKGLGKGIRNIGPATIQRTKDSIMQEIHRIENGEEVIEEVIITDNFDFADLNKDELDHLIEQATDELRKRNKAIREKEKQNIKERRPQMLRKRVLTGKSYKEISADFGYSSSVSRQDCERLMTDFRWNSEDWPYSKEFYEGVDLGDLSKEEKDKMIETIELYEKREGLVG